MMFEVSTFRDTNIFILQGANIEEMQSMLDEHVLLSQSIRQDPGALPLLEEANEWFHTMMATQRILDVWVKVQQNYLYLWPIFNSAGIQEDVKQLLDSESFSKVDKNWQRIMGELLQDKHALKIKDIKNIQSILNESQQ